MVNDLPRHLSTPTGAEILDEVMIEVSAYLGILDEIEDGLRNLSALCDQRDQAMKRCNKAHYSLSEYIGVSALSQASQRFVSQFTPPSID